MLAPGGNLVAMDDSDAVPEPAVGCKPRTDSGDETKSDLKSLAGVEQLVCLSVPVCEIRVVHCQFRLGAAQGRDQGRT